MTYRQIHVEMWDDPWVIELSPADKLLFIYLFSNSRTNPIGLYEISQRVIAFETGLTQDSIGAALASFCNAGKIQYQDNWIWVPKLLSRNINNIRSPQVQAMIKKQVVNIPDSCPFKDEWIRYYNDIIAPQYGIDTISIPRQMSQIPSVSVSATESDPVSVSESVDTISALNAYVKLRGGAVNTLDVDQITDLVNECEQHRASLPAGVPGADQTGDEWVRAAILEGNAARKDGPISLNYIKAILDRWRVAGFQARRGGDAVKVSGL